MTNLESAANAVLANAKEIAGFADFVMVRRDLIGALRSAIEPKAERGAIGRLPLTMEFMTIENAIVNGQVIQWACSCAHATKEEHESSLNRDGSR